MQKKKARALVINMLLKKVSYGITTGFGKFADVTINKEQTGQLQNIISYESRPKLLETLPLDIAKGIMLLRTINLIKDIQEQKNSC